MRKTLPYESGAANLYYLLYRGLIDDSDSHFMWREDPQICIWDDDRMIQEIAKMLKELAESYNQTVQSLLEDCNLPAEVDPALALVKETLAKTGDYTMDMVDIQNSILYSENVASETIRFLITEVGVKLTREQVKSLLEWSGDNAWTTVEDILDTAKVTV